MPFPERAGSAAHTPESGLGEPTGELSEFSFILSFYFAPNCPQTVFIEISITDANVRG